MQAGLHVQIKLIWHNVRQRTVLRRW